MMNQLYLIKQIKSIKAMDDVKSINIDQESRSKWHIYSFHVLVDAKLEIVSQCSITTTAAGFEHGLLSKQTSSGAG